MLSYRLPSPDESLAAVCIRPRCLACLVLVFDQFNPAGIEIVNGGNNADILRRLAQLGLLTDLRRDQASVLGNGILQNITRLSLFRLDAGWMSRTRDST